MSKNTRNRILLTAVAALLLVAVTVGGTVAWLTATAGDVVNTFKPSTINIDINEHKYVGTDTLGTEVVKTNEDYKMVPGDTLPKDPYVTVEAGSEATYVFVEIIKSATYDTYLENYVVDAERWTLVAQNATTAVYYTTQDAVASDADDVNIDILAPETLTVKQSVTKTQMDNITNNTVAKPTLTFKAYAIQSENLTTSVSSEIFELAGGTLPTT